MKRANIKINGEKKKFNIPQDWEELNIKLFCNLLDHANSDKKEDINSMIAAALDLTIEEVYMIEVDSLNTHVVPSLLFLNDNKKWAELSKATKPNKVIKWGGVEFKPTLKIGEGTLGQKTEAESIINSDLSLYDKCLGVLNVYVNKDSLTIEEFNDVVNNEAALETFPVAAFFLRKLTNMRNIGVIASKAQSKINTLN